MNSTTILGGGLAGLSAGLVLTRAGRRVLVLEREPALGGLARTIVRGAFRFDLGGHRFFTRDKGIEAFLRELMGGELLSVPRKSQILLRGRYFDYPLRPLNALSGLGPWTTVRMLLDYAVEHARHRLRPPASVSLEDWVVSRFGRTMFEIYFKGYSEKIWGIPCERVCTEWVEQRIQGLSLGVAIRRALLGSAADLPTLAEAFLYPALGIGRIAERMREEIEPDGRVVTEARVERLEHDGGLVEGLAVVRGGRSCVVEGDEFISTIPLTALVRMLHPAAPAGVLEAASRLRYRDLVIVAVMLDRERVTDQTWTYVPGADIPFSRIHEPTNWSAAMAPRGKTLLVTEHFCFSGDGTWRARDEDLARMTIDHLGRMGFVDRREVIDSAVVRVAKAYPVFEVGYREHYDRVCEYLGRFRNLDIVGRGGTFKYLNMDHAIAAGIEAAERLIRRSGRGRGEDLTEPVLARMDA